MTNQQLNKLREIITESLTKTYDLSSGVLTPKQNAFVELSIAEIKKLNYVVTEEKSVKKVIKQVADKLPEPTTTKCD
jgi:hypothetical protein